MPAGSIVGFVIVLIILLASLCVVSLLCLKYGICKRITHRSPRNQSGTAVQRNHSLMVPAPVRASRRSHSQKLINKSTRRREPTYLRSPPSSHRVEWTSNMAPPTPLECAHHTLPSTPHTPITPGISFAKPTSPMMTASSREGATTAQVMAMNSPPPYRTVGCYPYQPFKSPLSPNMIRPQGCSYPLQQTADPHLPAFPPVTSIQPAELLSERTVSSKETSNSTPSHLPNLSPVTGEAPTVLQSERTVVVVEPDHDDQPNTPDSLGPTSEVLPTPYITDI